MLNVELKRQNDRTTEWWNEKSEEKKSMSRWRKAKESRLKNQESRKKKDKSEQELKGPSPTPQQTEKNIEC